MSESDWEFWRRTTYGSKLYRRFEVDNNGKLLMHVRETQELDAFLDRNVALANQGFDRKAEFWPTASVPLSLIQQWRSEGLDYFDPNNERIVNRKLNSSDYRKLRTGDHKL